MPIEAKDLYKYFSEAVRSCEAFNHWKKSGQRKFVFDHDDFLTTIEMEPMNRLGANTHHLSLTVAVSIPSQIEPIQDLYGRKRKKGTLLFQWSARTGKGFGHPTIGSSRTWIIETTEDVETFKSEILSTVTEDLPAYIEAINTKEKILDYVAEHEGVYASLPLFLNEMGASRARKELLKFIGSIPEYRPDASLFNWLERYELLPEDVLDRLKRASIQAQDTYAQRMKEIHDELAAEI